MTARWRLRSARARPDPADTSTGGDSPAAIGNRTAQATLDACFNDGANEAHNHADTTGWFADNPALDFTGSPYFPGGLGEFVASAPNGEVRLQWI